MKLFTKDWVDAVSDALAGSGEVAEAAGDSVVTFQYLVRGTDDGDVLYRLIFAGGTAKAEFGSGDYDVQLECDAEAAAAIAQGLVNAQAAFMEGKLKIIGNLAMLLKHQLILTAITTPVASVSTS